MRVLLVMVGGAVLLLGCETLQTGPGQEAGGQILGGAATIAGMLIPPPFNMMIPTLAALVGILIKPKPKTPAA